jgi:hypothetical protein
VPADRLVGEEGTGFRTAMEALDAGRLGIAACAVGLAQGALDYAVRYAREREQFGQAIIDFQGLGFMLADMATAVSAARALTLAAARLKDAGLPYRIEAAKAKLFATDAAMRVTTDAVQVLGGYGYVADHPVERYLREAKVLQIVEGTNQIQRLVIARDLARTCACADRPVPGRVVSSPWKRSTVRSWPRCARTAGCRTPTSPRRWGCRCQRCTSGYAGWSSGGWSAGTRRGSTTRRSAFR